MGSASSPMQKSHALTPSAKCANGFGILAMAAVAALTTTLALQRLPASPATILGAARCRIRAATGIFSPFSLSG